MKLLTWEGREVEDRTVRMPCIDENHSRLYSKPNRRTTPMKSGNRMDRGRILNMSMSSPKKDGNGGTGIERRKVRSIIRENSG